MKQYTYGKFMNDIEESMINHYLLQQIGLKVSKAEDTFMEEYVKGKLFWRSDKNTIKYFKKLHDFLQEAYYILLTNSKIEKIKEVSDKNSIKSLKKEKENTLSQIKKLKKDCKTLLNTPELYKDRLRNCFNYGFVYTSIVELKETKDSNVKWNNDIIFEKILKTSIKLLEQKEQELNRQEIKYVSEEEMKFKKLKEIQQKINEEKRTRDEIVDRYSDSLDDAKKDERRYSKPGKFEPTNRGGGKVGVAKNGDYYVVSTPDYGLAEDVEKAIDERMENLQKAKDRQVNIEGKIKRVEIDTSKELKKLYGEFFALKRELENSSNYGRLMKKYGIVDLEQERNARKL